MPDVSTEPQVTPNQKSINWKRILIFVVIGVAVIGLGVLIFLILQPKEETTIPVATKKATPSAKKDETSDWIEFVGNLEYSLKYPKNYKAYNVTSGEPQKDPKNSRFVVFTNQTIESLHPDYPDAADVTVLNPTNDFVRIFIYDKNIINLSDDRYANPYYHNYPLKNKSLKEIATFTREGNINNPKPPKPTSQVFLTKLTDQNAYYYKMSGIDGFDGISGGHSLAGEFDTLTVIYVESEGNIFEILYTPTSTGDKILSTFKFLD